ncbi:TetR/AcrR family transcriptional regulator [Skermania sp. ID1734]|uniref:TetR/AcrR family transcriptional regulator n=1 Tax=Skermania sp. ID1734 TaxID=2597516 RepID=UPI00163D4DA9|nr:TetR/AcrR family transcriptional regulator [Skermania sp. ID1734]
MATAVELLGAGGVQAATVSQISDRAGVSRPFFYEAFDDLDALLRAVFEEALAVVVAEVVTAVEQAPATVRAKTHAAISAFIRYGEANPAIVRAAFVEAPYHPTIRALMRQARETIAALVFEQMRTFYRLGTERESRARFAAHLLIAGSVDIMGSWITGQLDLTPEELIDYFTDHYVAVADDLADLTPTEHTTH